MKKKNNIYMLVLFTVLAIAGCKKDSIFGGSDHAIATFQLSQEGNLLDASIGLDSIIITAPTSLSLDGAKANLLMSENASISPNPLSITNWNEPQTFTVKSYNGEAHLYYYKVKRSVMASEGDILLAKQEDVDSLAALNLDRINGSLIIGSVTGSDVDLDLSKLAGIKSIADDLIVNPAYAGKDITALTGLESVGSIKISANKNLESVSLPNLKTVFSDLILNGLDVKSVIFPALTRIDKTLQLLSLDVCETTDFPKLESALLGITIEASYSNNTIQTTFDLPVLKTVVGNILFSRYPKVTKIELPALSTTGGFSVTSSENLQSIDAPLLQNIAGNANFSYNNKLVSLNLESLKTVGGNFDLNNLELLSNLAGLKSLVSVVGGLSITYIPSITDNLNGLSSLKKVGGRFYTVGIPITSFSGLSLTNVGELGFYGDGGTTVISSIDLSNINVEKAITIGYIKNRFKLKGKDINTCSVSIDADIDFATDVTGFKQVQNFTYSSSVPNPVVENQVLPIEKILGDFQINVSGYKKFSIPNLIEIGGTTSFGINSPMIVELPKLKSIGGATTLSVGSSSMDVFSLPELEIVKGNFRITTGNNIGSIREIQAPKLKTVNGTLQIQGQSSGVYANTKMTNLNGFSALANVEGITISYNTVLTDYSAFKNLLPGLNSTTWKTLGNTLYNPTYQDMLDGKYIKP